jgi:hypothetical protein
MSRGFSLCVRVRIGTLALHKSEGAAAFRLLNAAQLIDAASASGLFDVSSPQKPEISRTNFSHREAHFTD